LAARRKRKLGRAPRPAPAAVRRRRAPDVLPLVAPVEAAIGAEFDRLIAQVMAEIDDLLIAQGVRRDAVSIRELFRTLSNRLNPRAILERLFGQVDKEQAQALREQLPTIPLPSVVSNGARLKEQWVTRNTDLIRAEAPVRRAVERVLSQPLDEGVRVEEIRKQLQERLGIEKRRAQLIARDQTLKLAGQLAEARQTQAGIRRYVWTTSADERVRPDHADLDGRTFEWAEPPIVDKRTGRRGHPGEDFQCRCTADPVLDDPEPEETEPREVPASPPEPELEPLFPPVQEPSALGFAPPRELLQQAEAFEVHRGLRPVAEAEAEAAIGNALRGKTLEDLQAIPFNATQLAEDASLLWLRQSTEFLATGNVPDAIGRSRGGLPQITIEADGRVLLGNGRHRLTVAREKGLRQLQVHLRKLGPRGGELWAYIGLVRI
jgi:SPP1 gp7 family putative phage head morphogenesis protein